MTGPLVLVLCSAEHTKIPPIRGRLHTAPYLRHGTAGQFVDQWFGIVLSFRWTGAAVAAAVMAFPLMVRIRLAVEAVDHKLKAAAAAATLGAPPASLFATVTLPRKRCGRPVAGSA